MTDIAITPANVIPGSDAVIEHGWAGATITAGQVVYLAESTDSRYRLADSNVETPAEVHVVRGIALHGASNGQPLAIAKAGPVTIGGALVANVAYYLSDVPGGIAPIADVQALEFPTVIGMSTSTTVLDIDIQSGGGKL